MENGGLRGLVDRRDPIKDDASSGQRGDGDNDDVAWSSRGRVWCRGPKPVISVPV